MGAADETTVSPFVGRGEAMALIERAARQARAGAGRLVLVSGEPGIGKTRLALETTRQLRAEGTPVFWGRCVEGGGAPPYWPWTQALGAAFDLARAPEVDREFLAPILKGSDATERRATDPRVADAARLAMFQACCDAIARMSRLQPLCLVLDDLHEADEASLLLLLFLARRLPETSVLIIGTHREAEIEHDATLARIFGDLVRQSEAIPLTGLAEDATGSLIAATAGQAVSATLVQELQTASGGNPFFLDELIRVLVAERRLEDPGGVGAVPRRVRETIRRRVDLLPAPTRRVLNEAAVVGRRFDVRTIAHTLATSVDSVRESLAPAIAAGLLTGGAVHDHAFVHALVRDTVHDDLAPATQAEAHRRVGMGLAAMHAGDLDPVVSALAHHFRLGGAESAPLLVRYERRAAALALASFAFEDAIRGLERALDALPRPDSIGDFTRLELTLTLADALYRSGNGDRARATYDRALDLARGQDDPIAIARVLAAPALDIFELNLDPDREATIERAVGALPPTETVLRAKLLMRLARGRVWNAAAPTDSGSRLAEDATAIARAHGDPELLCEALITLTAVSYGPGREAEAERLASEAIALADRLGNDILGFEARGWRIVILFVQGDVRAAEMEVSVAARQCDRLRSDFGASVVALWRVMRALMVGQFDAAAAELATLVGRPKSAGSTHANAGLLIPHGQLIVDRGRGIDEVPTIPPTPVTVSGGIDQTGALCETAMLCLAAGNRDGAYSAFRAALAGVPALRRDARWLMAVCRLGMVAAELRDDASAGLYDLLLPFEPLLVVLGPGVVCLGPVGRVLGVLATTLRRWPEAERHLSGALERATATGALPFVARTLHDLAVLRLARGEAGDREEALALLARADALAADLGMEPLRVAIAALGATRAPLPDQSAVGTTHGTLQREGDYWTITFAGTTCRLRDLHGLHVLAYLITRPGVEIHVNELVGLTTKAMGAGARASALRVREAEAEGRTVAIDLGDAGPVLDDQARAAYARRVTELREELTEAEEHHDLGRIEHLRGELEAVADEIARAGRGKVAGAHAERARLTVAKALDRALVRIRAENPALAQHLGRTIRRGYFCSYVPDPLQPVTWE